MALHLTGADNASPYLQYIQRRRRRPPGNTGDSQLTAGRPVVLTAPPSRAALNMKSNLAMVGFFERSKQKIYWKVA